MLVVHLLGRPLEMLDRRGLVQIAKMCKLIEAARLGRKDRIVPH